MKYMYNNFKFDRNMVINEIVLVELNTCNN